MADLDLNMRVLVVDDMPAMRSIVRGMLEELGFGRVEEAEDGDMAWGLVRQATETFQLIIADWNMPGMTGADLLRAVRSHPPSRQTRFIMITAQGGRAHLAEAVSAGVNDFVVKPFNAQELAEKIRGVFLDQA